MSHRMPMTCLIMLMCDRTTVMGISTSEPNAMIRLHSKTLLLFSLGSFFLYSLLAGLLHMFFGQGNLLLIADADLQWFLQLAIGTGAGVAAGLVAWLLFEKTALRSVLDDFLVVRTVGRMTLSRVDRLQLSLFAGVGEELLFRGAIQPLLGLWVTSVLFIALHGYVSFRSARHMLFGLVMIGLAIMLGMLFEYAGLLAAMTAHAVYDLIALEFMVKKRLTHPPEQTA